MGKKLAIFIIAASLCLGLMACSKAAETLQGNTNGNYNNYALFAEKDGWIYFSDVMDKYSLKKQKLNESTKTSLGETNVKDINVVGEWLYYVKMNDSAESMETYMYRMKTDGTDKQQIGSTQCDYFATFIVVGETIYFSNFEDDSCLYSMKTDGSEIKKLNDVKTYRQCIDGEWIFYIHPVVDEETGESNNQLRKIKIDGTEDMLLQDGVGNDALAHEGWVYYTSALSNLQLQKIKYDGSEQTKLTDFGVSSLNIKDQILYYIKLEEALLYSMELEGGETKQLTQTNSNGVLIAGDWIYTMQNGGRLYRLKLDGTGLEKAYTVPLVAADTASTPIVEGIGNSNANLNGEAKFVYGDGWIYFNTRIFQGPLKKMRSDGTELSTVAEVAATRLNLVGEWLYFIDQNFYSCLARIKTDGTEYGVIFDNSCSELIVCDDWLYFTNQAENGHIYKIKIDGTELTQLADDSAVNLNLAGDWLIYALRSEDYFEKNGIYKIKTDGSERTNILDQPISSMTVEGDWIYYTTSDEMGERQLRKIKSDGSGDVPLNTDDWVTLAGVHEGSLYYFNGAEEEGLIRTNLDGTDKKVLVGPGNYVWIHFFDDKIIFFDNYNEIYQIIYTDGTKIAEFPE